MEDYELDALSNDYIAACDKVFSALRKTKKAMLDNLIKLFPDHKEDVEDYWNTLINECWDL